MLMGWTVDIVGSKNSWIKLSYSGVYDFSLAGIVRNQDLAINFGYLYKVLARLEKFCQGTPIGNIWRVAVGFLD